MRRRRIITFGSVLAMVFSLAAAVYLVWFVGWLIDGELRFRSKWWYFENGTSTSIRARANNFLFGWVGTGGNPNADFAPNVVGLGPVTFHSSNHGFQRLSTVMIPDWLPIPVLAAYPIAYFAWRIHRRRRPGHCLHCDYDLTGNESGACPECGEPVPNDACSASPNLEQHQP
jgi:hypothetical protein